jgi:hypothetical protein
MMKVYFFIPCESFEIFQSMGDLISGKLETWKVKKEPMKLANGNSLGIYLLAK